MIQDPTPTDQLPLRLAEEVQITRAEADAFLEALAAAVYNQLRGSPSVAVEIVGLARFHIIFRAARMSRNPATGAPCQIPAKAILKCHVAAEAKVAVGAGGPSSEDDDDIVDVVSSGAPLRPADIAPHSNLSEPAIAACLRMLPSIIIECVLTPPHSSCLLPGLGEFRLARRAAGIGINPATKEQVTIPARTIFKCQVATEARGAVLRSLNSPE